MSNYTSTLWAKLYEEQLDNNDVNDMESTTKSDIELPPRNMSQRWRLYSHHAKRRVFERFSKWCPKTTATSNLFIYLKTDQTFPEFVLKSIIGFFGGIVLTYLCFVFFVFQLSISLIHATIISSIIGVLLTFGLAFSYRIRCLVFLLIPQMFSRVGRYTLTCYALVLILTGPATNTLKNSEVLTESMACTQEQIKTNVKQIADSAKNPLNSMKDTIKVMMARLNEIANKVDGLLAKINRLVNGIVDVLQSSYSWFHSVAKKCNIKFGTPYEHCVKVLTRKDSQNKELDEQGIPILPNTSYILKAVCSTIKSESNVCKVADFAEVSIAATLKRRLRTFINHVKTMFFIKVYTHQSYIFTNISRSPGQVTAGIVTEIRNRADPLLTWLSWSSCVTSLFLLLIIFRAKYYQHMYETRSRFDNRYITKELRELNSQRLQEGRETVLPLNRRERVKYVTTTSFRLVASERVHLTRSLLFMAITTFKLMIHMIADYSLYWVLMTIRYHGKRQTPLRPGPADVGIIITGTGLIADMIRSIFRALTGPLADTSSLSCLPDPYPPDLRRYTQIGILIFLLWFFALFEPYGLRLRHLIMGHYRPERAKARALWLYNHILRTRGSFMKFARRKLRKEYKYLPEEKLTFRYWLQTHIPFLWLRYILGISNKQPKCLLCNAKELKSNTASELIRCESHGCPGTFCNSCFTDMGRLCTICLTPVDYGDFSDISLEKGSSEGSRDSSSQSDDDKLNLLPKPKYFFKPKRSHESDEQDRLLGNLRKDKIKKPRFYSLNKINDNQDTEQLLSNSSDDDCEKERTNRRHVVVNALDLTHFSVPHNNITVGYVYQHYFCNNKHGNLPYRILKNKSGNDNYSEPCHKSSKNNYGTFIKGTSVQESVIKSKENYAQNKIPAKVIRKRDIIKILGTLQRKYKMQLKKRSQTFKINRRPSQNYYQQQLKVLPNIVQSRLSRSFTCFSLPIRLSNVQYVTLKRNRRKTKTLLSVAAAHKLHLKGNINSRKAIQNTTFDSNKKNRAQSSKNIKQIKSETNVPCGSGKRNENVRNNANNRSPGTKKLKKKKHNENKRRCSCVIKLRKLFFKCFSQLNVALKEKQASQKRLTKTTRKYLKQANNYKRRKKHLNNPHKKDSGIKLTCNTKTDIELTRQYRIYTFLKEGDWIKGQFGRNSNSKGNINIVENDKDCYINVKAEFQKIREKYKNNNIKRNHKKIEKEECPCAQNICCGCKETCKSNKLENEKQLEKDNTGNRMVPTESSAAQSKESIAPHGDETYSIKSIDHFHVPVLSKSHSYIEQYENDVEPHDFNKFSPSVKSFSIRNVKLYISKKFLHMQFRYPITTLKNILSSSMSIIKNKLSTSNVTLFEKEKPYYVDKSITVLPMVVSRSCECMITKTPTNKYSEKYSPVKTLKLNQSYAKDKEIDIQKRECTCNTEHLTNGRENEINKIGERFKGNASYANATTNKDLKSHTTDSTRTDTTICSYMTVDFIDEVPRKHNVKVITKSNQSTATDRAELCDVSTVTSDWWSPILEKKELNFTREARRKNRERKSVKTSTDGRVVTFESRPHVIPSDNSYILSPSRYLLESQKYYNELFSPKLYAPHLLPAIRAGQKNKVNFTTNRANKNLFHKNKRILRTNERLGGRSSGTVMRQRLYNIGSSKSDDTTSTFS